MRIELSSSVIRDQIDLCLVNETNNLDVSGGSEVLNTSQGTSRNQTGTVTLLGTPSDLLTLGVADD